MSHSASDTREMLQRKLDAIFVEILNVQSVFEDDDEVCEVAYQLQDEFNALSNTIVDKSRAIFPDPLDAFPPEIWQAIILETIHVDNLRWEQPDFIFTLTSVSVAWFRKITGNPLFWTNISLGICALDSAAKAATCLELSRECSISLFTDYPYYEWTKILPLVLPHTGRIVNLWLSGRHEIDILNSITMLPNLCAFSCDTLGDTIYSNKSFKASESIDRSRMPRLQRVPIEMDCPPATSPWLRFAEDISFEGESLSGDHVDSLQRAPRLRRLYIDEIERLDMVRSDTTKAPLWNLESLVYSGVNPRKALGLVGRSLTTLHITCAYLDFLWDVVSLAQEIPLSDLALSCHNDGTASGLVRNRLSGITPQPELVALGIKQLEIRYPSSMTNPAYDDWVQSIHQVVTYALVGVENLSLTSALLTPQVQKYIELLSGLTELTLNQCIAEETGSFSLRAPRTLKRVNCDPVDIWLPISLRDGSPLTRLVAHISFCRRHEPDDHDGDYLSLIKCDSMNEFGSNIGVSLANSIPSKSVYDIQSIDITGDDQRPSGYIEDLLEIAISRPGDFPGLKRISFARPLEWDLLILMLERRNLQAKLGISPLTDMDLNPEPPKHLRQVLIALLAGRYPARMSLESYSLYAIGRRMFDPKASGCYRCCFLLPDCDSTPQPPNTQSNVFPYFHEYLEELARNHQFQELITAEPPLTRRDAKWLAGLKRRRQGFWEGYVKSLSLFSRAESCLRRNEWLNLNASEYDEYNA